MIGGKGRWLLSGVSFVLAIGIGYIVWRGAGSGSRDGVVVSEPPPVAQPSNRESQESSFGSEELSELMAQFRVDDEYVGVFSLLPLPEMKARLERGDVKEMSACATAFVAKWFNEVDDASEIGSWVSERSPPSDFALAYEKLALKWFDIDPDAAVTWVVEIEHPKIQSRIIDRMLFRCQSLSEDGLSLSLVLANAGEVPEEQHKRLERTLRSWYTRDRDRVKAVLARSDIPDENRERLRKIFRKKSEERQ